jgi:hypothetical protein
VQRLLVQRLSSHADTTRFVAQRRLGRVGRRRDEARDSIRRHYAGVAGAVRWAAFTGGGKGTWTNTKDDSSGNGEGTWTWTSTEQCTRKGAKACEACGSGSEGHGNTAAKTRDVRPTRVELGTTPVGLKLWKLIMFRLDLGSFVMTVAARDNALWGRCQGLGAEHVPAARVYPLQLYT